MSKDPEQIVVAVNGEIYVAPEGTTLPTHEGSALNSAFTELGYATEDGVSLGRSQSITDIRVWQSRYPARRIVDDEVLTAGFSMSQWNKDTTELAFGGEVEDLGGGHYKLTPLPIDDAIRVVALVIDWHDGDKDYRLVVPRATVSETQDIPLIRTGEAALGVVLSVLAEEGGGDPWYIATNDANFSS